MMVRFPVGRGRAMVDLRGLRVHHLRPAAPDRHAGAAELVAAALRQPLDASDPDELFRSRSSFTIVVPDATRKAEIPLVLEVLLRRMSAANAAAEITVLVACGTHPPPSPRELQEIVGDLPAGVRVSCHDSRREEDLETVGELADGMPLRVNRLLVDGAAVITVGAVRHHYFAGFGGGPKMIFPGCAGYREIQANHARVLRFTEAGPLLDPGCRPGKLEANPVAEEIARAAEMCPPDLTLCLVCDGAGTVAWAGAGAWRAAMDAATTMARRWFELPPRRFRLMVACGGGYPSDDTLIQAHKGLDAASRFLEEGGELVYFASLAGGLGAEEMRVFVDDPAPQRIIARLQDAWVQYGHTTLRIVDKTARATIWLISDLDTECSRRLGFLPHAEPATLIEEWRSRHGGEAVGVMTGAAVYPAAD